MMGLTAYPGFWRSLAGMRASFPDVRVGEEHAILCKRGQGGNAPLVPESHTGLLEPQQNATSSSAVQGLYQVRVAEVVYAVALSMYLSEVGWSGGRRGVKTACLDKAQQKSPRRL